MAMSPEAPQAAPAEAQSPDQSGATGEFSKMVMNIDQGIQMLGQILTKANAPKESLEYMGQSYMFFQKAVKALSGQGEQEETEYQDGSESSPDQGMSPMETGGRSAMPADSMRTR